MARLWVLPYGNSIGHPRVRVVAICGRRYKNRDFLRASRRQPLTDCLLLHTEVCEDAYICRAVAQVARLVLQPKRTKEKVNKKPPTIPETIRRPLGNGR